MHRRSYVVLTASLLTAGCTGRPTDSTPTDTTRTETDDTTTSNTQTTTTGSTSDGYTGFTANVADEKVDQTTNPPTVPSGEPIRIEFTARNEEGERTSYTLVVQLQEYETDGGSVSVVSRETLSRSSLTVEDGAKKTGTTDVTANETGENYRFAFLWYEGDAPESPSEDTAADSSHFPMQLRDA